MQARPDGPDRDPEHLGHVDRGEPEVVLQDEDSPLVRGEPLECPVEPIALGHGAELIGSDGPIRVVGEQPQGARCTLAALRLGRAGTDDDAVAPGFEAVGIAQSGQLVPDRDEGLLKRVLREVRVAQDAVGNRVQPPGADLDQRGERLLVSLRGPLDELSQHRAP